MADVITTQADTLRGGIEANQFASFVLDVGGPGLFWVMKSLLVVGMALVVWLAVRFGRQYPGERAQLCLKLVARTMQCCVVLLTITVLGNASVAAQLTA
jgi:hypothetical protein